MIFWAAFWLFIILGIVVSHWLFIGAGALLLIAAWASN